MIHKTISAACLVLLLSACQPAAEPDPAPSSEAEPVPVLSSAEPQEAKSEAYLDDRSSPEQIVHSLYNALSRKEYLRAYSYYDGNTLPEFEVWAAGYEGSHDFSVLYGNITSDAGAGHVSYRVPVAVQATNKDGQVEIFSGCYTAHLTQPAAQATPPFRPLSISAATLKASDQPFEQSVPAACE